MSVYAGAGMSPASGERCVGIGTYQGVPLAVEGLGGTCCVPAVARYPREPGGAQGLDDGGMAQPTRTQGCRSWRRSLASTVARRAPKVTESAAAFLK